LIKYSCRIKLFMLVGIQVINLILQLRLDADLAWSMAYVLGDFSEAPVPLFQPFVDEAIRACQPCRI